jgi:methylthioribose-1-phosphate isomerase
MQTAGGDGPVTTELDSEIVPIRWVGGVDDGHVEMLDQRRLPDEEVWLEMTSAKEVAEGIREMVIRGAPAIGIAAAYGAVLAVRDAVADGVPDTPAAAVRPEFEKLADTRPTAVNLTWALNRLREVVEANAERPRNELLERVFERAHAIRERDRENNLQLARHGADLLPDDAGVLTHCNTGGLATGGIGTALGVVRAGVAEGRIDRIWIDETRPYLQGSRLTAWECVKDDLPATLITDDMAAHFMADGEIDAVVVGADRVAANGDVANKIGTYGLAVLCDAHDLPFIVAAPTSTIDLETPTGEEIPIEQRSAREVTHIGDTAIAPEGTDVAHPAFDITPASYIDAIATEAGVAEPPFSESLRELVH